MLGLTQPERELCKTMLEQEWSAPECVTIILLARLTNSMSDEVAAHYVSAYRDVDALLMEMTDATDTGAEG